MNLLRSFVHRPLAALHAQGRAVGVERSDGGRSRTTKRIDQTRQTMFAEYPGEDGA